MTRWARANNVHKHKPADATPWKQLKASGSTEGPGTSAGGHASTHDRAPKAPLHIQKGQGIKKPNKKTQEHETEDVNGFLEYLKQTGQTLQKRPPGKYDDLREEVAIALKKDERRENRRIKRQNTKKSNMVRAN